ncbi:MAG: acylphosphatase [archaeon]
MCWKLEFAGKDSEDIQGVTLRETIRGIACRMNVNGIVRNEKNNGKVVVLCSVESKEKAKEFFEKIIRNDDSLSNNRIDRNQSIITKITFNPKDNCPKFNGFQIEREDELTEMVWALQGSGKLLSMQEERRQKSLNRALQFGLKNISSCVNELQTIQRLEKRFILLSVDNYIKECPSNKNNDILMTNLYELHNLCEQANNIIRIKEENRNKEQNNELKELLSKILIICPEIEANI